MTRTRSTPTCPRSPTRSTSSSAPRGGAAKRWPRRQRAGPRDRRGRREQRGRYPAPGRAGGRRDPRRGGQRGRRRASRPPSRPGIRGQGVRVDPRCSSGSMPWSRSSSALIESLRARRDSPGCRAAALEGDLGASAGGHAAAARFGPEAGGAAPGRRARANRAGNLGGGAEQSCGGFDAQSPATTRSQASDQRAGEGRAGGGRGWLVALGRGRRQQHSGGPDDAEGARLVALEHGAQRDPA